MTHDNEEPSAASASYAVALAIGCAASLLAAFALYRTGQLDAFDLELVHASSRHTDTVCDLIQEVQSLRARIESLEKGDK